MEIIRAARHVVVRTLPDASGSALCIVAGIALGQSAARACSRPSARPRSPRSTCRSRVLIWLMIIPMLLKIDFAALGAGAAALARHRRHAVHQLGGQAVLDGAARLALHRPCCSRRWLPADQIDSYIAGLILLAAAPCTAMVFVWCNLTRRRAALHAVAGGARTTPSWSFAFAPIVGLLLGLSAITVPWDTLLLSVALYIVVPVVARAAAGGRRCCAAAAQRAAIALLARLQPVSLVGAAARRWCCCSASRASRSSRSRWSSRCSPCRS